MINSSVSPELVGTSDLVASIITSLQEPNRIGVLVAGKAGLGKTALARAVVGQLGTRFKPYWILPAAAMTGLRFGALAPFLGSCPSSESSMPVLRQMERLLGQRLEAGEPKAIVVIDDAHQLDQGSCTVLAQLAVTGLVKLLVLCRPKPGPPAEFVSLWGEGILPRFDLSSLNSPQVHQLCEQVLGGQVLINASTALGKASGGNPLFLLALVRQAKEYGQLVERNDVWMLKKYQLRADPQLKDLVREQLSSRSADELEVLETVALAEPVPLAWLRRLTGEADLDALQEEGLIRISRGPLLLVRSASPLMAEVLRGLVPPARSSRIRSRFIDAMDGTTSEETHARFVSWSLDCGAVVPDQQLLRSAATDNRHYEPMEALRTASLIRGPEYKTSANIEMAHAYIQLGDLRRAATLLQACTKPPTDQATARTTSFLSARVHLGLGGHAPGLKRIAERDDCRLVYLHALHLEGRNAEIEPELHELAANSEADPLSRSIALYLWAESLAATGHPAAAARATAEILQLLGRTQEAEFRYFELARLKHSLALVRMGKWGAVFQPPAESPWPGFSSGLHFGGGQCLVEGLAGIRQGDMQTALRQLSAASEAFRESDFDHLLPYSLGMASYAASLLGRGDLVALYSEAFEQIPYQAAAHFQLTGQAYLAAARSCLHGASKAVREVGLIADRAKSLGLVMAERDARELAFRLGDGGQVQRLIDLTNEGEGPEAECLNAYVRGVSDGDAERLIAASERAQEMRYHLLAAECLGKAASLLSGSRDRKRVRAVLNLLQLRRSELAGISTPLLAAEDGMALTPREREIVRMVINGKSNRDIAGLSSLSVRTVEGHLYRIFSKLGINRREDLMSLRSQIPNLQ